MREACCLWLSAARSCALGGDRGRSEQPAEACLAGQDRPALGRPAWARSRSCAGPARPSPASGAGRRATCEAGVDGLLRDKTRPARIPRLAAELVERVVARTLAAAARRGDPLDRARAWRATIGISPASVQRIWARPRAAAAPGADLQALQRPGVRRQAARRGRALRRPAGACGRAVGRREVACVDGPRLARG